MRVLVTGGAGYIGSHTCLTLLQAGHNLTVIDNLSNSRDESLRRVQELAGRPLQFVVADLLDRSAVRAAFSVAPVDAVMHFAGLKSVRESVAEPLRYYHNNVTGTLNLLETMLGAGVRRFVFSSSATVYGEPHWVPLTENHPLAPVNPYGQTKRMIEDILRDLAAAEPALNIAILRYFNPVGAHPSGRIGEDPRGVPNNLFPYVAQVAVGRRPEVLVTGGDYPTPDGTGIRDYIHVVDLAEGHLQALERLGERPGLVTYNLGTGRGHSVLQVLEAFGRAAGRPIPYRIAEKRPGDVATNFADPSKALRELDWAAKLDLDAMCEDTWRWQSANPNGYDQPS